MRCLILAFFRMLIGMTVVLIRHLRREINVPGGQKRQSFEFISRAEIQYKFSFMINLDLPVKPENDKKKEQ